MYSVFLLRFKCCYSVSDMRGVNFCTSLYNSSYNNLVELGSRFWGHHSISIHFPVIANKRSIILLYVLDYCTLKSSFPHLIPLFCIIAIILDF